MAKIEVVLDFVNNLLDKNPDIEWWTIREIWYRFISSLDSDGNRYKTTYSQFDTQMTKLRDKGLVSDSWFPDRGRHWVMCDVTQETLDEYFERWLDETGIADNLFNKDIWEEQPYHIIVIAEKDSLEAILESVTKKYRIRLLPSRGWCSRTWKLNVANEYKPDKENIILYIGDFDASGLGMDDNWREWLGKRGYEYEIRRVMLTEEQIDEYKLIPDPEKKKDTRAKKHIEKYGDVKYEVEALQPKDKQHILEESIKSYIDFDKWNTLLEQETKDRAELKKRFTNVVDKVKKVD